MKNNVYPIDLIEIVTEKDEINQIVEKTRTTCTVFAEINSVSQTEFFSGGRIGLQPSLKAVIYDFEYTDEPIVKWNGKLYSVYRTYYINGADRVELYLEERGGTKDEPNLEEGGGTEDEPNLEEGGGTEDEPNLEEGGGTEDEPNLEEGGGTKG